MHGSQNGHPGIVVTSAGDWTAAAATKATAATPASDIPDDVLHHVGVVTRAVYEAALAGVPSDQLFTICTTAAADGRKERRRDTGIKAFLGALDAGPVADTGPVRELAARLYDVAVDLSRLDQLHP